MIKYCPKCHKEAYRLIESNGNIKVVLPNGSTVLNLGRSSKVSMNISCPSGHSVPLELGEQK